MRHGSQKSTFSKREKDIHLLICFTHLRFLLPISRFEMVARATILAYAFKPFESFNPFKPYNLLGIVSHSDVRIFAAFLAF